MSVQCLGGGCRRCLDTILPVTSSGGSLVWSGCWVRRLRRCIIALHVAEATVCHAGTEFENVAPGDLLQAIPILQRLGAFFYVHAETLHDLDLPTDVSTQALASWSGSLGLDKSVVVSLECYPSCSVVDMSKPFCRPAFSIFARCLALQPESFAKMAIQATLRYSSRPYKSRLVEMLANSSLQKISQSFSGYSNMLLLLCIL